MYYLGVDGGGTHTTAVVADRNGKIIAKADGGSINYNSIGLEQARNNMREIITWLCEACQIDSFTSAFIGMSAISARAGYEETLSFADKIIPAEKTVMDSDVYIALAALDAKDVCAVAISGTGSMAAGRKKDGEIIHTGGWGHILGDEGSAYAIALDAVKAAVRGYEKSGPETALTDLVKDYFCISDYLELIDIFYNPPIDKAQIAKLSPIVFECAGQGDKVASQILKDNANELAKTTLSLLQRLEGCDILGVWGGVFENRRSYLEMFKQSINEKLLHIKVTLLPNPPVIGAVTAAIKEGEKI